MVHKLAPPDDDGDDGTREPWYKLQCVRMFIWGPPCICALVFTNPFIFMEPHTVAF